MLLTSLYFSRGDRSPLDTPSVPEKPPGIPPSPLHGRGGSGHVSRGRGIKVRQSWSFKGSPACSGFAGMRQEMLWISFGGLFYGRKKPRPLICARVCACSPCCFTDRFRAGRRAAAVYAGIQSRFLCAAGDGAADARHVHHAQPRQDLRREYAGSGRIRRRRAHYGRSEGRCGREQGQEGHYAESQRRRLRPSCPKRWLLIMTP